MQEMGCNAWRTAHNPPTPSLLDATDRLGMLVWDENHRNQVDPEFRWISEDLDSLVLRDRNHPSIIMWPICNEVLCENFNGNNSRILRDRIKELDPLGQRPVTAAMNGGYDSEEFIESLDVMGINYHHGQYDSFHAKKPKKALIGSETSSDVSDRRVYANDPTDRKYVSAYDVNYPGWGETAENSWCSVETRDFIAGSFIWTGFDYKGEPTPYGWPNVNSHFGIVDIAGFVKDNFHYYRSVWGDKPMGS